GGSIIRLRDGGRREVCVDFEAQCAQEAEGGGLGMALHPKFNDATSPQPYIYTWYSYEPTMALRLSRWTYHPDTGKCDSELVMIQQAEGTRQHNGARIRFGPDGFLYFGNGDDVRRDETTQKIDGALFSGIFRIDVDMVGGTVSHAPPRQPLDAVTQGYFIPNDNPFVGVPNANEEYYALGFRNPYAFTFDRTTGTMYMGDVGETWREEINVVEKGGNYGWPFFEGNKRFNPGMPTLGTLKMPLYDYPHHEVADISATMMGFVYRGSALPELTGKVIFSDWPAGRIWALDPATATRQSLFEWNSPLTSPVGFGQDAAGEIYVIAWNTIRRIERAPMPHGLPMKLSETRFFKDLTTLVPSSALKAYTIRSPLWSDGAAKQRWAYVPSGSRAAMQPDGGLELPPGSMLVKQFDLPADAQPTNGRTKRIETRVLVVGTDDVYGVSYRWKHDGSDADLVFDPANERIDDVNPAETREWHYPSSGECWSCHRAENRVLGFNGGQLNFALGDGTNQLTALATGGMFDMATLQNALPPLADPSDTTASIEARASAYLAANCSGCHHEGAAYLGGVSWNASPGVAPQDRGLINAEHHNYPMAGVFGLISAPLVKPGDPEGSILFHRIKSADKDLMMPPVGRYRVDPVGVQVIGDWIRSLQ
ncbi:MAG: PQQ-dependent sugar dehydrogenase, partial [Myxococcaceae bacterium]|nr:PQQ-dependent sugar dehydrogenase [Myxococcaceae bacterium]